MPKADYAKNGYDGRYQRALAELRAGPPQPCQHCGRAQAVTCDHVPPLRLHDHRPNDPTCCQLVPSCIPCNDAGGKLVQQGLWRPGIEVASLELEPERDGLPASDKRWRQAWWLKPFLDVPPDATWPRLMTVPHPRACDSLGPDFVDWAEERAGRPLRFWQRLVAARLLEVDEDERLVWDAGCVLSTARQVGKSYLLKELALWRLEQGERFGEPQLVLLTSKDLPSGKEVLREARIWAKTLPRTYVVREANGEQEIMLRQDGSRVLLRAREATYGYSVSLGIVDEGWRVAAASVDEGLSPTQAERIQPQLLLVSTAHRRATTLMLSRRQAALAHLEDGLGDLLIEWSAPENAALDDREAWRLASPHWSERREKLIAARYEGILGGDISDPEEPDPQESFKAQWLNIWPRRLADPTGPTEPLLAPGIWQGLASPTDAMTEDTPIFVALEDDYGMGASVACARRLDDDRIELDGWCTGDWNAAVRDVENLRAAYQMRKLVVGASLLDRLPQGLRARAEARSGTNTRLGLALLRDLALSGQLVHDSGSRDLDQAIGLAAVREAPTGLFLLAKGRTDLVRASVWALAEAHKRAPVPAIM